MRPRMADTANASASQRFTLRSRNRAALRTRRLKRVAAALLPFGLLSCVGSNAVSPVEKFTAIPFRISFPDIPVIAGSPIRPIDVVDVVPVTPAGPSFVAALGQRDRMRATLCLASAVYYEAATEPDEGQRAVAQVVLNRVRHPQWPHTVCGVVYQGSSAPGCQFSFACDGAMARAPMLSAWIRARRVAERALAGEVYPPIGSATCYHTVHVAPAWRHRMTPVAIVGAHIFYRMPGDVLQATALPMRYGGGEPAPGPLPRVAPPAELMQIAMTTPTTATGAAVATAYAPAPRSPDTLIIPSNDSRYVPGALPDSDIRPEFKDSGQWIAR